jgi:uncharacterized protein YodC (DUF2158 family)
MDITKKEKKSPVENSQTKLSEKYDYGKVALILSGVILLFLFFGGGFVLGRYLTRPNRPIASKGPMGEHLGRGNNLDRQGGRLEMKGRGLLGEVTKLETDKITVRTRNDEEKIIIVNDQTKIKKQREDIKVGDIKEGDNIMVVGKASEEGTFLAKLIKVLGPKAEAFPEDSQSNQEIGI